MAGSALFTAILDSIVSGHEKLIDGLQLPAPKDRHVLAAAIAGHADAIVTFNLKDFPVEILALHHIEVQHPDAFIMNQLELRGLPHTAAYLAKASRLI